MSELVIFLEEPSAAALIEGLLPRLLPPGTSHRCVIFEGKQDLEAQLVRRMRGYRVPDARFVVLRDQDSGDCRKIKAGLVAKCRQAARPEFLVRIACHEIESWYLADLAAVELALGLRGVARLQRRRQYAHPDSYPGAASTLKRVAPRYQKVGGSRAIGPHLDLANTRSPSFRVFVWGLRRLLSLPSARPAAG